MKRIVWISVALLIMVLIMAFGLHTLNDIDKKNKEYRQRKEGEAFASKVAIVPQTTSIYDKLRVTETSTDVVIVVAPDGEQPNTEANEENTPVTPDAPEQTPEQTTTVTNDVIVVTP